MPTHTQRARLRPSRALGRWRSIPSDRARDEDLHFFLQMSKFSRRTIANYVDGLLGTG